MLKYFSKWQNNEDSTLKRPFTEKPEAEIKCAARESR